MLLHVFVIGLNELGSLQELVARRLGRFAVLRNRNRLDGQFHGVIVDLLQRLRAAVGDEFQRILIGNANPISDLVPLAHAGDRLDFDQRADGEVQFLGVDFLKRFLAGDGVRFHLRAKHAG